MSTPFKINKYLLKYFLKYNHLHKLLRSSDYIHPLANIKRGKNNKKRC
jgi:hypothetical protein